MNDGIEIIARLPYPSTQPKRFATASEVATMDFLRRFGIPVPKVFAYSADASNAVGAEYILMERVDGRPLGDVWYDRSNKERERIFSQIAEIESKSSTIDVAACTQVQWKISMTERRQENLSSTAGGSRRHAHFYYMGATASKNNSHFKALLEDGDLLGRKLFRHACAPWAGNNFLLKADLVIVARHWEASLPKATNGSPSQLCPISFEISDIETIRDAIIRQEEADEQLDVLRGIIRIGRDGSVLDEGFEDAKLGAAAMQAEALRSADDDLEREMIIRHWPFDDHDETE